MLVIDNAIKTPIRAMLQSYVEILRLQTSPDQFLMIIDKSKDCIAALNHIRCSKVCYP